MSIITDLRAEDMQQNAKALTKDLQDSLPIGLKCGLFIFTADEGPVAFAFTGDKEKMKSVLRQTLKNLDRALNGKVEG